MLGANELDYKMIGQRIRAERNKKGWQQAELAFRAGMSPAHLSHIETAQTKLALPTIVRIANALSVSVDDLLYDSIEQVKIVYDRKIAEELADCDPAELQAFLEIILSTKKSPSQKPKGNYDLLIFYGAFSRCLIVFYVTDMIG